MWNFIQICHFFLKILTLKMPKETSAYVVCWLFLQTFQTYFCIQAYSVDPDQTAPRGAAWSGSTLFAKMTFKITSRWQSRRQLLWLSIYWLSGYHFVGKQGLYLCQIFNGFCPLTRLKPPTPIINVYAKAIQVRERKPSADGQTFIRPDTPTPGFRDYFEWEITCFIRG